MLQILENVKVQGHCEIKYVNCTFWRCWVS